MLVSSLCHRSQIDVFCLLFFEQPRRASFVLWWCSCQNLSPCVDRRRKHGAFRTSKAALIRRIISRSGPHRQRIVPLKRCEGMMGIESCLQLNELHITHLEDSLAGSFARSSRIQILFEPILILSMAFVFVSVSSSFTSSFFTSASVLTSLSLAFPCCSLFPDTRHVCV